MDGRFDDIFDLCRCGWLLLLVVRVSVLRQVGRARLCCAMGCPWRCHGHRRYGEGVLVFVEDKDGVEDDAIFSVNFSLTPLSLALPGRLGCFVDDTLLPTR